MDGVGLDALGEILADRAVIGVGRVGGAHHLAVLGNGILAFEDLNHHRSGNHEVAQIVKERPLGMYVVKPLRLLPGQADPALGDDPQTGLFEPGIDLAGEIAPGGVRFDDRKCTFDGHCIEPRCCLENWVKRNPS